MRDILIFFPININIKDKLVIIIGGGKVALRKLKLLLPYEPRIKIIAKNVKCEEIRDMEKKYDNFEIFEKEVDKNDLDMAFLVVMATNDNTLNDDFSKYLDNKNIIVNNVSNNNFAIFPAIFKKKDVIVSISTSGISPYIASKIRDKLDADFDNKYIQSLELIKQYRKKIKELIKDPKKRKNTIKKVSEFIISKMNKPHNEIIEQIEVLIKELKLKQNDK